MKLVRGRAFLDELITRKQSDVETARQELNFLDAEASRLREADEWMDGVSKGWISLDSVDSIPTALLHLEVENLNMPLPLAKKIRSAGFGSVLLFFDPNVRVSPGQLREHLQMSSRHFRQMKAAFREIGLLDAWVDFSAGQLPRH